MDENKRRRERVVVLFSTEEVQRIDAFRASQSIEHRSEIFRHAVMSLVERWEKKQALE